MSTAALPVELLIEIFEITMVNVRPEVGVFQQANRPTMANASAPTESTDEDSDDDEDDGDGDDGDDDDEGEKWDEGHFTSSSDVESEGIGERDTSDEPIQSEEDEVQGPDAPGLLDVRRQGDDTVKWSALKTCRL